MLSCLTACPVTSSPALAPAVAPVAAAAYAPYGEAARGTAAPSPAASTKGWEAERSASSTTTWPVRVTWSPACAARPEGAKPAVHTTRSASLWPPAQRTPPGSTAWAGQALGAHTPRPGTVIKDLGYYLTARCLAHSGSRGEGRQGAWAG